MDWDEKHTFFFLIILVGVVESLLVRPLDLKKKDAPVIYHQVHHGSNGVQKHPSTQRHQFIHHREKLKNMNNLRPKLVHGRVKQFPDENKDKLKELLWLINYYPLNEPIDNYPQAEFLNEENDYEFPYDSLRGRQYDEDFTNYDGINAPYEDYSLDMEGSQMHGRVNGAEANNEQQQKKILENVHHFVLEIPREVFNETHKGIRTSNDTKCMGDILYPLYADASNENLLLGYMHHRMTTHPGLFNALSTMEKPRSSLFNRNYTQIYKDIKNGLVTSHHEHPIYMEIGNKKVFIGYIHHIVLNTTVGSLMKMNETDERRLLFPYANYEQMLVGLNDNRRPFYDGIMNPYAATMSHIIIPFYGFKRHGEFSMTSHKTHFGRTFFPSAHHGLYYGLSRTIQDRSLLKWPVYNTKVIIYTQRPIMGGNWIGRYKEQWFYKRLLKYITQMGMNVYPHREAGIFNMYPYNYAPRYWYQESRASVFSPDYTGVIMHFYIPLGYVPKGDRNAIEKYKEYLLDIQHRTKDREHGHEEYPVPQPYKPWVRRNETNLGKLDHDINEETIAKYPITTSTSNEGRWASSEEEIMDSGRRNWNEEGDEDKTTSRYPEMMDERTTRISEQEVWTTPEPRTIIERTTWESYWNDEYPDNVKPTPTSTTTEKIWDTTEQKSENDKSDWKSPFNYDDTIPNQEIKFDYVVTPSTQNKDGGNKEPKTEMTENDQWNEEETTSYYPEATTTYVGLTPTPLGMEQWRTEKPEPITEKTERENYLQKEEEKTTNEYLETTRAVTPSSLDMEGWRTEKPDAITKKAEWEPYWDKEKERTTTGYPETTKAVTPSPYGFEEWRTEKPETFTEETEQERYWEQEAEKNNKWIS